MKQRISDIPPIAQVAATATKASAALPVMAHEIFCKAYVTSGNGSVAFKYAFGVDGAQKEIKALLELPNVTERIQHLSNKRLEIMQHSADVSVDILVRELEQARQVALDNDEPSAAISATMGKAKLHGLLVDKREMTLKRPEDMTETEIVKLLGFESVTDFWANKDKLIEHNPSDT